MKTIKQTYVINAPLDQVWRAFIDPDLINQWGAGPAKMTDDVGAKFSLWGGDIHGTNTKVIKEKLLQQDWYGEDEPDRCYKVSFRFNSDGGTTEVELIHPDIPDEQVKDFAGGWTDFYFDPIKKLLEKS